MRGGGRNYTGGPRAALSAGAAVLRAFVTSPRTCGILTRMQKWALLQTEGPGKGRIVPLEKESRTIGRGADAHIRITDTMASRHHARLLAGEHGCILTDEGSANGTVVDGERIKERLLTLGETFTIGQCSFHLIMSDELLAPGRSIGVWEIGELLDVDAVTWRYRARQKILEREVELEILRASLTGDEELLELLRSLLRRIAAASDPQIVPVFDLAETEGRMLVARRFTPRATLVWEGLTLRERGARIGEVLAMLDRWAERGAGVPLGLDRLMADQEGRLLFRVPAALDLHVVRRRLHTAVPAYLPYAAPEELAGGPPGPRAELYRLGVLVFHALTGRTPREGRTRADFLQALSQPLPGARELSPQIPPRAAQLVAALLSENPAARPEIAAVAKEWPAIQFPARVPVPARNDAPRESAPAVPRAGRESAPDARPEPRRPFVPKPAPRDSTARRAAAAIAALAAAAGVFFLSSRIVYWLLGNAP